MEVPELKNIPFPGPEAGKSALRSIIQTRNILNVLESVHLEMGDVFRIPLPGFKPIFLIGPEANRFVTVTSRDDLKWRNESDPVTKLLKNGILVTDGDFHDEIRHAINPALHKQVVLEYFPKMLARTDEIIDQWKNGHHYDMLNEMRKIALLIIMDTLFDIDFSKELDTLWIDIIKILKYISPGIWIFNSEIPRPGYKRSIHKINSYFFEQISERKKDQQNGTDLLSILISNPNFNEQLIRDQLLTLFIAGHDTSTATLAWTLHLLSSNPNILKNVQREVDLVLKDENPTQDKVNQLSYLEMVIKESLRLFPPIHIGNRIAVNDLNFQGYKIPSGSRVVYSIYLSHRHPDYWEKPGEFIPERFDIENNRKRIPYIYMPFGGGHRNCIGMTFALVEAKLVIARIIQKWKFTNKDNTQVKPYMGATLEPRPGVFLIVEKRNNLQTSPII
jgi:cytochrome P450